MGLNPRQGTITKEQYVAIRRASISSSSEIAALEARKADLEGELASVNAELEAALAEASVFAVSNVQSLLSDYEDQHPTNLPSDEDILSRRTRRER